MGSARDKQAQYFEWQADCQLETTSSKSSACEASQSETCIWTFALRCSPSQPKEGPASLAAPTAAQWAWHTHRLWNFYLVVVLPSFDFCSLSALSSFCRFGYFVISKTGDWHQQKMNTMVSTPFRFLQHRNIFPICQNFAGSSPRSRTSRNPLKALAAIWAAAAR